MCSLLSSRSGFLSSPNPEKGLSLSFLLWSGWLSLSLCQEGLGQNTTSLEVQIQEKRTWKWTLVYLLTLSRSLTDSEDFFIFQGEFRLNWVEPSRKESWKEEGDDGYTIQRNLFCLHHFNLTLVVVVVVLLTLVYFIIFFISVWKLQSSCCHNDVYSELLPWQTDFFSYFKIAFQKFQPAKKPFPCNCNLSRKAFQQRKYLDFLMFADRISMSMNQVW